MPPKLCDPLADSMNPEALLQRSTAILRYAGEGIYGLDRNGNTTFVNPAGAAMLGYEATELCGQPQHALIHHSHADGHSYPREQCPIYAAFRDGEVHEVLDEVFWRKDGTSFPVEYVSTPIFDEEGNLDGAVVTFRDVTTRRAEQARLQAALEEVQRLKDQLEAENRYLREELREGRSLDDMIGGSTTLSEAKRRIQQVAGTDATVLILGETGVGKERFARAVHELSHRSDGPLIKLNCAALPSTLIESELFGHEKGAFTGATARRAGRFELANGGTIFLDEVGEMPLELQAKLLRVLQEGEVERLGGSRTLKVDVRVVAATNRNLKEMVAKGTFRDDLYYRLNVFPVSVPPLRRRKDDIPALVDHFVARFRQKLGRPIRTIPSEGLAALGRYDWPGNIRELENVVERAVILATDERLPLEDALGAGSEFSPPNRNAEAPTAGDESTLPSTQAAIPDGAANDGGAPAPTASSPRLEDVERDHIKAILRRTEGRIEGPKGAAMLLDMHPNTLRSRMKKLGIQRRA